MRGRPGLLVKRCIEDALDEFSGERRLRPGRVRSRSPSRPDWAKRFRHRMTVLRLTPSSRAMAWFANPCAQAQNNVRSQDHFLRRIAASNEATKSVSLRSG